MSNIVRLFALTALTISTPIYAYIGPGLGAGTVGVILGVLGSILLALFAIFWYPIKRLFKKGKKPEAAVPDEPETGANIERDAQTDADHGKG